MNFCCYLCSFGNSYPYAKDYYDAIVNKTMFISLSKVMDLQRNDFIVAKYFGNATSTGHSMIVISAPQVIIAKKPFLTGAFDYV